MDSLRYSSALQVQSMQIIEALKVMVDADHLRHVHKRRVAFRRKYKDQGVHRNDYVVITGRDRICEEFEVFMICGLLMRKKF